MSSSESRALDLVVFGVLFAALGRAGMDREDAFWVFLGGVAPFQRGRVASSDAERQSNRRRPQRVPSGDLRRTNARMKPVGRNRAVRA